jgi:tetratricopeptide (TPR) repeat protein
VGCGNGEAVPFAAEVDEPYFRQGQQLAKQGRSPEALTSYLKLIEKRGEQNAPESHLEAGLIYLQHIKDPIEAYHHFRKYLELQPNSRQADLVRQRVDAAKREFARTLPARPVEDQSVRLELSEEFEKLRRENEELRAELATLRGGGATPVTRTPRLITVPDDPRPQTPPPLPSGSPITLAPSRPAPLAQPPMPTPVNPPANRVAPAKAAPAKAAPGGGRNHPVGQGDTVWSIARKYYGPAATAAKVQGILDANRDVLRGTGGLKPGMTLRIP